MLYRTTRRQLKEHELGGNKQNGLVGVETNTGRIHPHNGKPVYSMVIEDSMDTPDAGDTWINTGWTGLDTCAIVHFELDQGTADINVITEALSYVVDDNDEFRVWCKTDGTAYQKRMPDNQTPAMTSANGVKLYLFFEYTKKEDRGIYEDWSYSPYVKKFNLNSFSNVYWVDPTNGDDANSGSFASRKKTYNAAMALCSAGDAVIIGPGTFTADYMPAITYCDPSMGAENGTSIIAEYPGTVIFQSKQAGARDNPMFRGGTPVQADQAKFYGIIFEHTMTSAGSNNYRHAIFRVAGFKLINCAYFLDQSGSANYPPSIPYNNDNDHQSSADNCTFSTWHSTYGLKSFTSPYSGLNMDSTDCIFVSANSIGADLLGNSATIAETNFDKTHVDFDFSNNADIVLGVGVYTGPYAWPAKPSTYSF